MKRNATQKQSNMLELTKLLNNLDVFSKLFLTIKDISESKMHKPTCPMLKKEGFMQRQLRANIRILTQLKILVDTRYYNGYHSYYLSMNQS